MISANSICAVRIATQVCNNIHEQAILKKPADWVSCRRAVIRVFSYTAKYKHKFANDQSVNSLQKCIICYCFGENVTHIDKLVKHVEFLWSCAMALMCSTVINFFFLVILLPFLLFLSFFLHFFSKFIGSGFTETVFSSWTEGLRSWIWTERKSMEESHLFYNIK